MRVGSTKHVMVMRGTACAVVVLLAGLTGAPTLRADDTPGITLTVADGRVSLDAQDVTLKAILDEIGERTGVRVQFDESGEGQLEAELVTISLRDTPVEEALRQLLRGRDFVIVSSAGRPPEAHVYGRSGAAAEPPPAASVSSTPSARPPDASGLARLRSEALESPDPAARGRALEGLAASGNWEWTREAAVAMLERESNSGLLQRALDLVAADRTIPVEPLVKLALTNPAPEVRVKALTQLGARAVAEPRAREALQASAADDPVPNVRDAARALLQQPGAP